MAAQAHEQRITDRKLAARAGGLMNQQVWCWGRDILRPDGNWLLEIGFDRIEAPADYEGHSSVYSMELPRGRRVVLRGFGVFFGDDRLGGAFVPRYEFRPTFTACATLERPPWTKAELPKLHSPSEAEIPRCESLIAGLIDWIAAYEERVAEGLGTAYRQETLDRWDDGKRTIVPAEDFAAAWRSLGATAADRFQAFVA